MWGPWIEHDGKGCPVPVGTVLNTVTETYTGSFRNLSGPVFEEDLPAYDWRNWQVIGANGFRWGRVVRYRIRKPRGLEILEGILSDIDAPARETAS